MREKIASLTAIFAFLYPVITIIRVHYFDYDGSITSMSLSFLLMHAGMLVAFLMLRKEYSILKMAAACMLSLIPGMCAIMQFHGYGVAKAIFEALVYVLFYMIGLKGYLTGFLNLLNGLVLQAGIFMLAGALVIVHFYDKVSYLKGYFLAAAYLFLLLSLIIRSRENMDMVFHGRGISQPEVQGKINKYRKITIIALYTAILLLFNLKNIIVSVIKLIGAVANKMMELIIYIIKLLFRHKGGTYEQQFGFMPFDPRPSPYPIVILILYSAGYFILLFSIYKLLPVLYKKLREVFRRILDLTGALSKKRKIDHTNDDDECVDVIEIVKVEKNSKDLSAKKLKIKDKMRLLRNTREADKKVRMMYSIIVDHLLRNDLSIDQSDTTGEICTKVCKRKSIGECMNRVTKTYDRVRYGGKIPVDSELCEYENYFREIISG